MKMTIKGYIEGMVDLCISKIRGGIGFRDLESFNLALLAKQVWRLLFEPNSLWARVLRAKYCPDGKLLNAKPTLLLGKAFSQGWIVLNKVISGMWAMALKLTYGMTVGFQQVIIGKS
jgi:hypothetical protein